MSEPEQRLFALIHQYYYLHQWTPPLLQPQLFLRLVAPMASVSKVSILDYFNIVFEGENGKIESNCKACGTRIQAKRSVTSNFVTHLKVTGSKDPGLHSHSSWLRGGMLPSSLTAMSTSGGGGALYVIKLSPSDCQESGENSHLRVVSDVFVNQIP